MSLWTLRSVCLWLAVAVGVEEPAGPPPLKGTPEPIPAVKNPRHFVVQVKLIEVDEQGRETVLGEPKLKTTGGNAGISIDHPDGRRFEFTIRLTDRVNTSEELAPARTVALDKADSVLKKLEQKIDLDIQQQSRREVLREIARQAGVSIAVDPESVRGLADQMEAAIDMQVEDETVADALNRVIEPLKLGFTVKHDVVLIAAADKLLPAPADFVVKTYNVADLVKTDDPDTDPPELAALVERIKTSVLPASWERKESTATIRPFNSTQSIVIRQTVPGHLAIERLLEKIRREQPLKIPE